MGVNKIMEQQKNNQKPILEVKDLVKIYDDDTEGTAIVNHVDFTMYPNEFVCILGPSGCGKSTFIRCVGGFEKFQGTIAVNGTPIQGSGPDRVMVFQNFDQLLPWKTVEKNVQYPWKVQGLKEKEKLQEISDEYLEKVGLSKYAKFYPHQLSGGMKQRVAIAKALALKPQIILMDEPFASLDAMNRNKLLVEVAKIHKEENITVIFITHNIQEALSLGTRIVVMNRKGKIKMDVPNTLEKPVTPATKDYGKTWDLFNQALHEEDC